VDLTVSDLITDPWTLHRTPSLHGTPSLHPNPKTDPDKEASTTP
jgi:hypothetical protein